MKKCTKCPGSWPAEVGFYKAKENADGYMNTCKSCHNKRTGDRVKNLPEDEKEKLRAYHRAYDVKYHLREQI